MNKNEIKTKRTTAVPAFFLADGRLSTASLSLDEAADALLPDSLSAMPRLLPGLSLITLRYTTS